MDYSGLAAVSIAQIADKGRAVSLVYKTQGTYSPATDAFTGQSSTTQTVKMVVLNFKRSEIDETLIKTGDKRALLAPQTDLTRAPKTGDQVTDGSETFTIKNVEEVKTGDTVLLYKLHLSR